MLAARDHGRLAIRRKELRADAWRSIRGTAWPDMTVQVARIAVTRLKHEPRPLRLSYGGNVIRVRGNALKPERQFTQVGTELIGVDPSPFTHRNLPRLLLEAREGVAPTAKPPTEE